MNKIRLVIVDKHELFREGLCHLIKSEKDMDCAGTVATCDEAIRLVNDTQPDIVIVDVKLEHQNGINLAKQLKSLKNNLCVIMLTHEEDGHYVLNSIKAGTEGYILKDIPRSKLMHAIRVIQEGETVFSFTAAKSIRKMINDVDKKDSNSKPPCDLHLRELEVLSFATKGMTNKEIAHQMQISEHTVGAHLVSIFRKLQVESRLEAVLYALKMGWVSLNSKAPNSNLGQ